MEISAHLWQSRHGVYYFRETAVVAGKQTSKKVSLRTKDPKQAKRSAIQILASIAKQYEGQDMTRKFEVAFGPNGLSFKTDPNIPDDVEKLGMFLRDNKEQLKELVPQQVAVPTAEPTPVEGTAFDLVIEKYSKRKEKGLAPKTLYQYLRYIDIFKLWLEKQTGKKPYPINLIDRKIVAKYIEHLQSEGINNATIEKNYLRSLNSILEFAKTVGDFPEINVPTKGHKLTSAKEIAKNSKERNPFTLEELKTIFNSETFLKARHPDEFWLPLLALFTGGRASELAQLNIIDIGSKNGIPTIIITDENGGRLKSTASKRTIPIHPTLIELGFLEFVDDMRKFGFQIFPDVKPDIFGYCGKEPARRWSTYSDKVGITDKSKVFHSFRSTANNCLKQNGVSEEARCEFVGHDHDTINSKHYTEKYSIEYLYEHVVPKLRFDIDFAPLKYKRGNFDKFLVKELNRISKKEANKKIRTERTKKNFKEKNAEK
ncbi:phage integrase SAM-like domain-containing protein [Burkholderia multivorans]|uniref:phage integrase SAM-like domain-containing protein n=1 Tax=Burkholderia multivorans TaxID=87883 RepID=UPI000CFE99C5|nr:phage integrase SAM-like domain-containing protein [Burkholderia multivorans]MBU9572262.1 phage integrase SAM-like domain-containing protein [Burkholderia multivorans]MCS7633697.1 phage integrase SAM-like domain-containing protein [Pseudomonas aeruginosa]PRH27226.1 hypothetical protein C6T53_13105 [Burkholderia multivorans]